jgi:hypothetical protein
MRINTLFVIIMIALLSCHPDNGNPKEELRKVLTAYYDALAKKDTGEINKLTTANFVLFEDGLIYDNKSSLRAIQQMPAFTASFTIDSLNAHIDKGDASVYYTRGANFIFRDSIHIAKKFLESATFKKENNKWKLRFLHSSLRK